MSTDAADRHVEVLRVHAALEGALDAWGRALSLDIERWLGELKVHSVRFRVKTSDSLRGKLARPDRHYVDLWDVTDLLGLRVIVYFEDEVERAADLLDSKLALALERSIDKRRRADASSFGYRSVHYVCKVDEKRADAFGLPREACCEIQIRTMIEHAWAEIEHDLGYKSREVVPVVARRRLNRLAGLLELADQEFVAIRDDLTRYADALPRRVREEGDAVALDQFSLGVLVECDAVRSFDERVASRLAKALSAETFYPDYLLKMLFHAGFRTIGEVLDVVDRRSSDAVALVGPYFEFARSTWNFSLEKTAEIDRGYSLFFLVHAHLLAAEPLRVNKVQKLAGLYVALDYPEDERAAQRVAGLLVDSFTR